MSEKQKDTTNRYIAGMVLAGLAMGGAGLGLAANKPEASIHPVSHSQEADTANSHPVEFGKSDLRVAKPGEVVFGQSDLTVAPDKIVFGQSDLAVDPAQARVDKVLIDQGMATGLHVDNHTTPPPPHGAR